MNAATTVIIFGRCARRGWGTGRRPRLMWGAMVAVGGGRTCLPYRSRVSVPLVSRGAAHLVFTLILALGVQTAYVNPGVAAAEMRAVACCTHNCQEPVSLPSARGCCGLTAVTSGPAEAPVAHSEAPLAMAVAIVSSTTATPAAPIRGLARLVPVAGSAPPTFLEQRHLLL